MLHCRSAAGFDEHKRDSVFACKNACSVLERQRGNCTLQHGHSDTATRINEMDVFFSSSNPWPMVHPLKICVPSTSKRNMSYIVQLWHRLPPLTHAEELTVDIDARPWLPDASACVDGNEPAVRASSINASRSPIC